MACSAVRAPVLRNQTVRHYAAAAAAAQPSAASVPECRVLKNKVTAVAVDTDSPLSQVSIVFRAGPRNETYDLQGASHVLRIAAGLTTSRSSYFGITRNIQQLGGNLIAVSDRESIAYTLQVTRDHLSDALKFLEDVATRQVFKPWELADQSSRLRYELSTIPNTTRVIELLHKAAYQKGLGYSLYCPKRQIGKLNTECLQHFINTWFTGPRCAVVGTGVSLDELEAFGECLPVGSGDGAAETSKYHGGQLFKERNSPLATVAFAVEGAGLNNEKDALAFSVLQKAMGTGPHVKWGSSVAPLYKALTSAAGTDPFAVTAFNASYSDSGLFGVVLSAPGNIAGPLTLAANKLLKSGNLTDADITRGKNELKASVLFAADSNSAKLEALGQQALLQGSVKSASAIAADIDKISAADVKKVASKVSSGKRTLAAIGDLCSIPNVDQLC